MKIRPKPLRVTHRPDVPPLLEAIVTLTKAPREQTAQRAYHQLVTGQNVPPERAKTLLGIP